MRTLLIGMMIALASTWVCAQSQSATPVWIGGTSDDMIGRQLIYSIKEGIRRSVALTLVDRQQDARISVRIVTLDPDSKDGGGQQTVYSAVWTIRSFHDDPVEIYSTQFVGTCGRSRVEGCAQSLVATTDEQASMVRRWILNVLDAAKK